MQTKQPMTIRQAAADPRYPIGATQIRKLIRLGEIKKSGKAPEPDNYIMAENVGTGSHKARWSIQEEEMDAWKRRARERKALSSNRNA